MSSTTSLTVHHLQRGQSERILWLLEELTPKVPYKLEIHKRDPLMAPASLKAIHPQGSAPVIVDGDLILSESMAIVTYILTKYAPDTNLVVKPDEPNYTTYLYWLYFVLCTLQPAGSTTMFAYFEPSTPNDAPGRAFPRTRYQRLLELVDKRLSESEFLAGDRFTLADIMAVWCFTTSRTFLPYSLKPYPNILKYVERMTSREGYRRAMDKGDHGLPVLNGAEPGEKKALF